MSACGFCGFAPCAWPSSQIVAPSESLPMLLRALQTNDESRDFTFEHALKAKQALEEGGALCLYCHTRFESGRELAEKIASVDVVGEC